MKICGVFDAEEAMQPGAPQVHDHVQNNVCVMSIGLRDIEAGFAQADYVFEHSYNTSHRPLLPGKKGWIADFDRLQADTAYQHSRRSTSRDSLQATSVFLQQSQGKPSAISVRFGSIGHLRLAGR